MYTFDLRLALIPFSLLRISNTFSQMKPGEEMQIISNASEVDVSTMDDIKRLLPRSGYDIIASDGMADGPTMRLRLRKKIPTPPTKKENRHV
jgi:TusA-related sulfurtransferase